MSEDLLATRARRVKRVEFEDLGAHCFVRSLSVPEFTALYQGLKDDKDDASNEEVAANAAENSAMQIAAFLCDEQGVPRLTIEQARQFVADREMRQVRKIIKDGSDLNSLSEEGVETARGNSQSSPTDES